MKHLSALVRRMANRLLVLIYRACSHLGQGPRLIQWVRRVLAVASHARWFRRRVVDQSVFYRRDKERLQLPATRSDLVCQFHAALGRSADTPDVYLRRYAAMAAERLFTLFLTTQFPAQQLSPILEVVGASVLTGQLKMGKGVIVVGWHGAWNRMGVAALEAITGREPTRIGMMHRRVSAHDLRTYSQATTVGFAAQLMEARAALRQGHAVYVLADGGTSPRWSEVDFPGAKRPLRVGFAQLALITGAPVIVNQVVAQPGGTYRVEFAGPLDPGTGAQTEEQRIRQLVQAFADYLAHWWEESDWLIYSHSAMAEYLALPPLDRKDVGVTGA